MFSHLGELVAFIGLAPKETLSGSSIRGIRGKPRLCKIGQARLRKTLYMPALVSIQCNPRMITFYYRLKDKGKNGKVIVCAIMRKLVPVIFGVLKSGKKYDPIFLSIYPFDKNGIESKTICRCPSLMIFVIKGVQIQVEKNLLEAVANWEANERRGWPYNGQPLSSFFLSFSPTR
jgi:hypothetical protein